MKFIIFICFLLSGTITQAHELEILFYRAPSPIKWNTPGNLVRSMAKNLVAKVDGENYPHPISHVNIRLHCDSHQEIYRGMTSVKSNASYLRDFFVQGSSLDTMIINQRGRSYTKQEILYWLPRLRERGYARSLKIKLNSEQCHRAEQYLADYAKTGLQRIYGGLRSDPLRGEGAGCSAFAVSILRVLQILPDSVAHQWQRKIRIPLELLSSQYRSSAISFFDYLRGDDWSWANSGNPHILLKFWDPELMFRWAKDNPTWDVRHLAVPNTPFFAWDKKSFFKTVRYHSNNVKRLLTDEELLNRTNRKCRNFRPCF